MTHCIGTPISWLRLEQYALGEGSSSERDSVATHLAQCPVCAGCFHTIESDQRALPPLPSLPSLASLASQASAIAATPSPNVRWLRRMAPVTTVLAVAASLALYIRSTSVVDGPSPLDDVRTKGVDYALDLTREGDGADVEAGYRDGDRWKVLVTCPTGRDTHLDVVVYDNLEPSFPLPALERLPCGNGIPLPGAFRLTGSQEMSVCLVWDEDKPLDRDMLRVTEMEKLPHRVCKTIRPAP